MILDWVEISMTVLTTGLFALVGFVWRFSHKVTKLEQDYESIKSRLRRMEGEHDKVMDRVYSLAKSRTEFMTRDSYHRDKNIDQIIRDVRGEK